MTQLHNEGAPELGNVNDFLQELRSQFEDISHGQEPEAEIKKIKQRGCLAKEYVQEFWRIARKLRRWPELLLVHYFKTGLDKELLQICLCQGITDHIHDWYQIAMDLELRQYKKEISEKKP